MESGGESIRGCYEERIYVSIRLRPLTDKEISSNDVSHWQCIDSSTIVYKNASYPTAYTFDRVFGSDCSTREVYEQGANDLAMSVIRGINSTVLAYGQTSSGKTYTMTGITEYAITDIFEHIQEHTERDFVLKFSAMEIYNDSVRDLLRTYNTPLRLLDDPERGTIVEKLAEEPVRDQDHVTALLSICQAQRQIDGNEMSSRSHQIIRLTVESSSRGRDNTTILTAAVNFVDLAGSEEAFQSSTAGTSCHIDRSLLTLATVIRKLSKEPNGHIPYRDSKLTRILETSLRGNARTAIICTMSPGRTDVDQSRNTLLFASCANEVTTNAQDNVVNLVSSRFYAILREKDAQIEKLEKEIKDLILQRDIAQSQVKEYLQMLGDDSSSMSQLGLGHYPHLRVQNSPDPQLSDVVNGTCSDRHSRSSSEDHFVKVPYFNENLFHTYASPRILLSSSDASETSPYNGWDEIEKLSGGTPTDFRCIETEELSDRVVIDSSSSEDNYGLTAKVHVDGDGKHLESRSLSLLKDQEFVSSCLKDGNETKEDIIMPSEEGRVERKESISPMFKTECDFSSIQYLDVASLENLSSRSARSLNLIRSKSCKASIVIESVSQRSNKMQYSDKKPAVGPEKESEGCETKIYAFNFGSNADRLSAKAGQSHSESSLDIEIETRVGDVDGNSSNTPDMWEKADLPTKQEITTKPENDNAPKVDESLKKNVKDVGSDPIEDEHRGLTSWPVEFKRLQREIVELWHACNVSLAHRTYFFLLFQGDPSDAIYLEVEIRRMKILKDKFARGDKALVNGQRLTLSSRLDCHVPFKTTSAKALRQERRMLSEQMMKKFSEQERKMLFVEWGIGLNTKMRRLQLANAVWTKTHDINHIADSAFLVAKLVGFIEPGQAHNRETLALKFAPKSSAGICSFKRSLVSLL